MPYDNTKSLDQALDYALDIAGSSDDCEIILLYVITPVSPPIPPSKTVGASIKHRDYLNKIYDDLETSASTVLEAKKKSILITLRVMSQELRTKSEITNPDKLSEPRNQ